MLGAILGEWFGAPAGLGVLIVSSMQNFQITLLWSAAFLGTAMSAAGYFALVIVQQKTTAPIRMVGARIRQFWTRYWGILLLLLVWQLLVAVNNLNTIVAPSPKAVLLALINDAEFFAVEAARTTLTASGGLALGLCSVLLPPACPGLLQS